MDLLGFEVLEDPQLVLLVGRHTIVTHERECYHKDLLGVRRIREGLGVSDHSCLEYSLSACADLRSEGGSRPCRPICKNELAFFGCHFRKNCRLLPGSCSLWVCSRRSNCFVPIKAPSHTQNPRACRAFAIPAFDLGQSDSQQTDGQENSVGLQMV
jgi:hypothetical protein